MKDNEQNGKMQRKKKLLVTASTFPRWKGDTEPRFVLDLASHMTDEFDVTVLVPASPGVKDTEIMDGVKVIRYHYFPIHKWETLCYPGAIVPRIKEKKVRILLVPFLFISLYFKLWRILPEYDIIHAHWLIPQGIVQSFFKKPYIVTGHGGDVTSLNKGIIKKLKVRCLKKASHVTVVSNYLKERVEELANYEIEEPSVISMGVDTSRFGKQYRVENYFNQGDKKVVLFVGRLAEKKGVTYLIEAMKAVDAVLIIVGNGPLHDKLVEQAKDLGNKVQFGGSKTHDELKTIYASADIFVAPSITAKDGDQEGIPTTIMEAMASGLPVIATNTGGISDIVNDGINGFLVPEKDSLAIREKIEEIMNNDELSCKLADHAIKDSQNFDYQVKAEQYKSLYRTISI